MTYEKIVSISGTGGLIYFVVLFAIVIAFALWPRNAKKFRDAANIPLKED